MKKYLIYLAVIAILVLSGYWIASGQGGPPPHGSKVQQADDIREAIFRYQYQFHDFGFRPRLYFLSLENRHDPSDVFLQRFKDMGGRVRKESQWKCHPKKDGIVDTRTGERGVRLSSEYIEWIRPTKVCVYGGYYAGGLSAAGYKYTVVYRNGHWKVARAEMLWES